MNNDFNEENVHYSIKFSVEVQFWDAEYYDHNDFVHQFIGDILQIDQDDKGRKIGEINLTVVDIAGGVQAKLNPFEIIDGVDQDLYNHGAVIFDENGDVLPQVKRAIPDAEWIGRLLILNRMKIEPEFRGRNLGLLAARQAIQFFGHACLVLAKPFPVQFSGFQDPNWVAPAGVTDKVTDFLAAQNKLQKYWKKLGLKRIGRTQYFGMDGTESLPPIGELLPD
jgi:hypothetical protein